MVFQNRAEAGRILATQLQQYDQRADVIVLGIPRGGVPVAFEIASGLDVPLDVFVVRKLGVLWHPELAFGAIASGGVRILDSGIVESTGISRAEMERVAAKEKEELRRREKLFRGSRAPLEVEGKTVILVDDGIATGSTTRAAITALRQLKPRRIVLATPVAPASTCDRLRTEVDELVCLQAPQSFYAIGEFYEDFTQVSDEEVTELLQRNRHKLAQKVLCGGPSMEKEFHHDSD